MELLIILFLILLNGVFAMSEIAMVASKKSRLQALSKKGDLTARKALELSQNPGKLLSTVQIGITLIGILLGIYSGASIEEKLHLWLSGFPLVADYSGPLAVIIIVILLTFFSLVLGELVPKRIGLTMPESVARVVALPMYWISLLAAPFVWLLTFTTDIIMRILNIRNKDGHKVTEDDIRAMIQEGTETGVVQEIEQDIVENVFHLGDRKIKTLMTQRSDIEWIDAGEPVELIGKQLIESTHQSLPVCRTDLDHVIGILNTKDVLNSLMAMKSFEVEKCLRPAIYLSQSSSAFKALETFRETKQRIAIVVDEFGSIQGLLTLSDLVDALIGDFAGQIHEQNEIIPREDGTYLVDASLPFPEFLRYFEIESDDDPEFSKINTLGGLIFYMAKRIPETGFRLSWKNLSMEVIDMDGRRVDKVLVKRDVSDE